MIGWRVPRGAPRGAPGGGGAAVTKGWRKGRSGVRARVGASRGARTRSLKLGDTNLRVTRNPHSRHHQGTYGPGAFYTAATAFEKAFDFIRQSPLILGLRIYSRFTFPRGRPRLFSFFFRFFFQPCRGGRPLLPMAVSMGRHHGSETTPPPHAIARPARTTERRRLGSWRSAAGVIVRWKRIGEKLRENDF